MALLAHLDGARGEHPLADHLMGTAALAEGFAAAFGSQAWGRLAGLWHDLGKHSHAFQSYIRGCDGPSAHVEGHVGRVDHSSAGAHHAATHFAAAHPVAGRILAYCIAGHHAGLTNWDTGSDACLASRLQRVRPETRDALAHAAGDLLTQPTPSGPRLTSEGTIAAQAFQTAVFTRMLFSCLVDADFLDTEQFMRPDRSSARQPVPPTMAAMEGALAAHLADKQAQAETGDVNRRRREVLDACRAAAGQAPGFFSLTVPTGGGKTLSSLAFALRHARSFGLRRVVYAIPYTSIIEQNAQVFRTALGGLAGDTVVEHHSNLDPLRETRWSRLACENWDAPLIVTTNVQLLESLFASRTSACRKLHRLPRSVIVLDEAQALPVELLAPCLVALRELVRNYGCTIVLCTATQPAIHRREGFPIGLQGVREIIPRPVELYERMRRVRTEYVGALPDDELVSRLAQHPQVLCVVNTRAHAAGVYSQLPRDGTAFHLSALMCPRHRSVVIWCIKRRLRAGRPCRLVSTQLIEAGVDIDFPVVYRAKAGLDSIAQAAGRCNREGRLPEGQVFVFDGPEPPPPGHLRQTADTAAELVGLYEDLLGLDAIQRYFELHYWKRSDAWDRHGVLGCFRLSTSCEPLCDFRRAAEAFRLIRDDADPVIIPWGRSGRKLVDRLRRDPLPDSRTRRALQRYTVSVHRQHRERLESQGALEFVHDQYPVLVDVDRYSRDLGLLPRDGPMIV